MASSYLVQVLVNVVAGDGRVGHKVEELPDRHDRHAAFHKEVWGETQGSLVRIREKKENTCRDTCTDYFC